MLNTIKSETQLIKQETNKQQNFTRKFIQIFSTVQSQTILTKDIVLEFAQLFYDNNKLFLQLFEQTQLLIFKTYNEQDGRTLRFTSSSISKGFEQLIKLFFMEMISIQFAVKQTSQQGDYFENFVDYFIAFFAEALTAGKNWIKEYSYRILVSTLKIIQQHLELDLFPQTVQIILSSVFYLLCSKIESHKKMAIQIYTLLSKLQIKSQQIEQLLFQYLQQTQDFNLRKLIIQSPLRINNPHKLERFLNRLKDKNPFIVEEVINKLITQKISINSFTQQDQILKLLIDGQGSHYQNVRNKTLEYFSESFLDFVFDQKEQQNNSVLEASSLDASGFQEVPIKLSPIQNFVRLFDFKKNQQQKDLFRVNPFVSSLVFQLINQIFSQPSLIQQRNILLKNTFSSINNFLANRQQLIYLYSILLGLCNQKSKDQKYLQSKRSLRKYIYESMDLPSPKSLIEFLKKLIKNKYNYQSLTKRVLLIKIIHILVIDIDAFDCVGKSIVKQELRKCVIDLKLWERVIIKSEKDPYLVEQTNDINSSNQIITNLLLKAHNVTSYAHHSCSIPIITEQCDLIGPMVEVIYFIEFKDVNKQNFQIKELIDQLIQSRQLCFQRQTMKTMLKKTTQQLDNSQQPQENTEPKPQKSKLSGINEEIQKKLLQNQRTIEQNRLKALFVLAKILSIKNSKPCTQKINSIKASDYFQLIKFELYKAQNSMPYFTDSQIKKTKSEQFVTLLLLYFYCSESQTNYLNFKKLFWYYALESDNNSLKSILTIRILSQLSFKYQTNTNQKKCIQEQNQNNSSFLKIVIDKLFMVNFSNPQQNHYLKEILFKHALKTKSFQQQEKFLQKFLIILAAENTINQGKSQNGLFQMALMIQTKNLNEKQTNFIEKSILICCIGAKGFAIGINEKQIKNKNQVGFLHMIKYLASLLKMTLQNSNKSIKQNYQTIVIVLKLTRKISIKIQNCYIFTCLQQVIKVFLNFSRNQKNKQANFVNDEQTDLQYLVFVKRQVQKSLDHINSSKQSANKKSQKQINCFLQQLQQINNFLEDQISDKIYVEQNNLFEHQSTDLYTGEFQRKKISTKQQLNRPKIKVQKIEFYEKQLNEKYLEIQLSGQKLYYDIKNTNFYMKAVQKISHQNVNIQNQLDLSYQSRKKVDSNDLQLRKPLKKKHLKKINSSGQSQIVDQINIYQASIKRSRYIIIPYEIVQRVEQKHKKRNEKHPKRFMKNYDKKKDKSFYAYINARSISQNVSNRLKNYGINSEELPSLQIQTKNIAEYQQGAEFKNNTDDNFQENFQQDQ